MQLFVNISDQSWLLHCGYSETA